VPPCTIRRARPAKQAVRAATRRPPNRCCASNPRAILFAAAAIPRSGVSGEARLALRQLLGDDPFFAWLKPVTALIVDIDEMARTDFETADVAAIADRVDHLFGAGAEGSFSAQYIPMLQRSVDVAIGHAALRKAAMRLRG